MFELARRSIEVKVEVSFNVEYIELPSKNIEEGVLIYRAFVLAEPYISFIVKNIVVPVVENVFGSWTSLLFVLTSTNKREFDPDALTTVGVPVIVVK
jgi:hypothetical protein